jgi:hypothetical protein
MKKLVAALLIASFAFVLTVLPSTKQDNESIVAKVVDPGTGGGR